MINKERLKILIKEKATIYYIASRSIYELNLKGEEYFKVNCKNNLLVFLYKKQCMPISNLYEKEKDAKFDLEYRNLSKEVFLDLPTWEEMTSKDSIYRHCGGWKFDFEEYRLGVYLPQYEGDREIIIVDKPCSDVYSQSIFFKSDKATEENYLKACKICRKLFFGEEIDNV